VANTPIISLAAESHLDVLVYLSTDGQVNIKGDGELACKVPLELKLKAIRRANSPVKEAEPTDWLSESALTKAEIDKCGQRK
jgi:hypothetical protein